MNNKGESQGMIGGFIIAFVGIVVAIALFQAIAQDVGVVQNTQTQGADYQVTLPANGESIDLVGQEILSTPAVTAVGNGTVLAANYTISEIVSTSTGVKTISYQVDTVTFENQLVNISYDYGGDGYIEDGGSRSIAGLITIFAALAILAIGLGLAISPKMRELMGM